MNVVFLETRNYWCRIQIFIVMWIILFKRQKCVIGIGISDCSKHVW